MPRAPGEIHRVDRAYARLKPLDGLARTRSASTAQRRYESQRDACHRPRLLDGEGRRALVRWLILRERWSPEQVAGRAALELGRGSGARLVTLVDRRSGFLACGRASSHTKANATFAQVLMFTGKWSEWSPGSEHRGHQELSRGAAPLVPRGAALLLNLLIFR